MLLAIFVIPKILVIAIRHSLFDEQNERKIHDGSVPRIGGVSFIPCILFGMMFTFGLFYKFAGETGYDGYFPDHSEFGFFLCGVLLIYLGGIKDDLVGLRYIHKFTIQFLSSVLVVFSNLYINNFYGFLGIYEISPWIGIPLTIFVLVFIINAMNLIDGMDGLASSISIFALCIYGTLFLLHDVWLYAALAFSTVGVLIPFFYYNVYGNVKRGRKLFMGDSGSLTLGFILGFLAIRYTCNTPELIMPIGNALVVSVSPILIPMLDVLRVILARIKKRKHLFKADRSHIHHKLMDMGLQKSSALILIMSISGGFCIINLFLMQFINCTFIFLMDIALWSLINVYFSLVVKKRKANADALKNSVWEETGKDGRLFRPL
jgi:UDP-N-acetylmuramyl pentapeptide phosphotransferase/UDP-N-acetylglucosamine-1-phosphate transferase